VNRDASTLVRIDLQNRNPYELPRERFFRDGPTSLSDIELLALILGGGNSLGRATTIMNALGSLEELKNAIPQELATIVGVGQAGACALSASVELCRRLNCSSRRHFERLNAPSDVAEIVRAKLSGSTQENFVALGLDSRQKLRLIQTIAIGSLAQVDVHPRELFRPLVRAGVHACVIAHNHPSGDLSPSEADLCLTRRMMEVGKIIGIPVLDHVIVSDRDWISLVERGFVAFHE